MADTRTFPEVEFCHRTADDILTELVESWENAMGRKLSAADPIRVMLAWEASIDAQLYATINESARLNLPRYAFGDYLDSMAEIFYWGLQRIPATAATTSPTPIHRRRGFFFCIVAGAAAGESASSTSCTDW